LLSDLGPQTSDLPRAAPSVVGAQPDAPTTRVGLEVGSRITGWCDAVRLQWPV